MQAIITTVVTALNFFPGIKTKAAAVAAFGLALVQSWNALVPTVGIEHLAIQIPEVVNAIVLAVLGIGAANQPSNVAKLAAPK